MFRFLKECVPVLNQSVEEFRSLIEGNFDTEQKNEIFYSSVFALKEKKNILHKNTVVYQNMPENESLVYTKKCASLS